MATNPIPGLDVAPQSRKSLYPEPYAQQVQGRVRRRLGDHFDLTNFGVNVTELAPGAVSALLHHHTRQDEFVYVLAGHPTLVLDGEEHALAPGDCCGFKAGFEVGHQLVNRTRQPVLYLEVGDRTAQDAVTYPRDDLALTQRADGSYLATHKDGRPY